MTSIIYDLFLGSDERACARAWVNDIVYMSLYCVLSAFERGCGPAAVDICQGARAAACAAPSSVVVASAVFSASASPSASIVSSDIPVNPEIPDAPAVEDPLLSGGGVVAVPEIF